MKKIKKVIALVLAGVILFGGMVFGDGTTTPAPINSFDIYTEVAGQSLIKVVGVTKNDPTTYSAFDILGVDESSVKIEKIGESVKVKKLAYFSNQKFTVTMTVAPMTSTSDNNTYNIHYSATCVDTAYTNPDTGQGSTQKSTATVIDETINSNVIVGAKVVSVVIDKVSFDDAPTDTYTGTITFTISAT